MSFVPELVLRFVVGAAVTVGLGLALPEYPFVAVLASLVAQMLL